MWLPPLSLLFSTPALLYSIQSALSSAPAARSPLSIWTSRLRSTMWMLTSSPGPFAPSVSPTTSLPGSSPSSQVGRAVSSFRVPQGLSHRFPWAPPKVPLFLPCYSLSMFPPCIFPFPAAWSSHMLMTSVLAPLPSRTAPIHDPSRQPSAPYGNYPCQEDRFLISQNRINPLAHPRIKGFSGRTAPPTCYPRWPNLFSLRQTSLARVMACPSYLLLG